MNESTPKPSAEQLRMALRIRLSARRGQLEPLEHATPQPVMIASASSPEDGGST
jgi:hypothetical protein